MNHLAALFATLSLVAVPASAQFVNANVLAVIDTVGVSVSMETGDAASNCLPFASTIKTKIELALQQAGLTVIDSAPASVFFSAVAIYPSLCAVAHEVEIWLWLYRAGIPAGAIGLSSSGIFSRNTPTQSKEEVRRLADDAVDTVINEILKGRRSR